MIVEVKCGNDECPGMVDGERTGFPAEVVPPNIGSPQYVEGSCPICGEEVVEYSMDDMLGPEDLAWLNCQFMSDRI